MYLMCVRGIKWNNLVALNRSMYRFSKIRQIRPWCSNQPWNFTMLVWSRSRTLMVSLNLIYREKRHWFICHTHTGYTTRKYCIYVTILIETDSRNIPHIPHHVFSWRFSLPLSLPFSQFGTLSLSQRSQFLYICLQSIVWSCCREHRLA